MPLDNGLVKKGDIAQADLAVAGRLNPMNMGGALGRNKKPVEAQRVMLGVFKGDLTQVLKVNPYHDASGKFTTKDKGKIPVGQAKELHGKVADKVIEAASGDQGLSKHLSKDDIETIHEYVKGGLEDGHDLARIHEQVQYELSDDGQERLATNDEAFKAYSAYVDSYAKKLKAK